MSDTTFPPWDFDDLPEEVSKHILTLAGRARGSYPEANSYRDGIESGAEWMAFWLFTLVCSSCGKDGNAPLAEHYDCGEWKWTTRAEWFRRALERKP